MSKRQGKPEGFPIVHDRAAGIDVGSRLHVVAVGPELSDEPVQSFQAFTGDIERMADWLIDGSRDLFHEVPPAVNEAICGSYAASMTCA